MIHQINMYGLDKVQTAIKRLQSFEPPEGYYLAFSGGKDSVVIKALADMAGVKYTAHYNLTSVDHPELVKFIKREHSDVIIDRPKDKNGNQLTMWNIIPSEGYPPTRLARYCCKHLKESNGHGHFVITGVRWAESTRRQATRGGLEFGKTKSKPADLYDPDNPNQQLIHNCTKWAKRHLNPIIEWTDAEVWEFIHEYKIPYCCLYDQGYKRLGCIGCPMAGDQKEGLEDNPKYKQAYIKAFDKMLIERKKRNKGGLPKHPEWKTGEEVYNWWVNEK